MGDDATDIKIEKDVPMPPGGGRVVSQPFPFDKMKKGDSFFVAGDKAQSLLSNRSRNYAVKNGVKFATRTVTETVNGKQVKGGRIWRVE